MRSGLPSAKKPGASTPENQHRKGRSNTHAKSALQPCALDQCRHRMNCYIRGPRFTMFCEEV